MAATACSAGVPSGVGVGWAGVEVVGEGDGSAVGAEAQDAHVIAVAATTAASRAVRSAEVTRQA